MFNRDYYIIKDEKLVAVFYIPLGIKPSEIIPKHVKIIGKEAFRGVNSIKKIVIPEGVEKIERGAFCESSSLEEVILPDSLTEVEDGAFASCTALEYVKYGKDTIFGNHCFSKCSRLKWIECDGIKARTFYFNHANRFAITIEQPLLSKGKCVVYRGRFAKEGFPTELPNVNAPTLYFCETHDHRFFWYSNQLEECYTAVDFQSSGLSFADYFHKEISFDGEITPLDFSFLTGICWAGRRGWVTMFGGDDNTPFPVAYVIGVLETRFPKACARLMYAINHQHDVTHLLTIDNGISLHDLGSFFSSENKMTD